jgi:SAM-dependent methyltransferase
MAAAGHSRLSGAWELFTVQGIGGLWEELNARLHYRLTRGGGGRSYLAFRTADWDRRRRVETEGWIKQEALKCESPCREYAKDYAPTDLWAFRANMAMVRKLGVRPSEFTLLDFGCGKGRVLLMALEAGFRAAAGVEYAPELAERAMENLRSYRGRRRSASVHCGDAAAFPIPPGPVVAFLCHPFDGPVLESVAANIARSFRENPRPMYVVYVNLPQDHPFARDSCFRLIESSPGRAIYRLGDPGTLDSRPQR